MTNPTGSPPPMPGLRNGYLASFVGSLAGLAMLGALATGLWWALDTRTCDPNGFECLGSAIATIFFGMLGAAIGAVLGCHAALRWRRYPGAGMTAWIELGLLVVSVAVASAVGNATRGWNAELAWVLVGGLALVPFVARRIALVFVRRKVAQIAGS